MIENKHWVVALLGVVRREDGSVNWGVITTSVLTAAIVGIANKVIDLERNVAAHHAEDAAIASQFKERLHALESGNSAATSERYRASDAARDQSRTDAAIKTIHENNAMVHADFERRLRALEIQRRVQ